MIGAVEDIQASAPGLDQPGVFELGEMERQGCRRHLELPGDNPGAKPIALFPAAAAHDALAALPHQQAKHRKARILRQRRKRLDRFFYVHISKNIELMRFVKIDKLLAGWKVAA